MGDRTGAYGVLVKRPEGKKPLGRSRHRWEDNIKFRRFEVNKILLNVEKYRPNDTASHP